MTKKEALKLKEEITAKLNNLEEFINQCDNPVGFNDDEIFLLSKEECEKYKDAIPVVKTWWWTRSANASFSSRAFYVFGFNGNVNYYGISGTRAVRPALTIDESTFTKRISVGDKVVKYGFPWIKIDDNLFISEMPIGFEHFDANSNNYENSYIRHWLLNWLNERKDL